MIYVIPLCLLYGGIVSYQGSVVRVQGSVVRGMFFINNIKINNLKTDPLPLITDP